MRSSFLILALAITTNALAYDLTGIARDFKMRFTFPGGHPDFEYGVSGLQKGLVYNTLAPDGTPVFSGHNGLGFITNSTTFGQWYHDDLGVNISAPRTISLDDIGGGKYAFDSQSFFPMDSMGYGNEGYQHNYSFTFQLSLTFGYDALKAHSFSFTSDDDLWVFINNRLAIDLGGTHDPLSDAIDLNANADALGLVSGHNYNMSIFFAERHTYGSQFHMETTLPLETVPEPTSSAVITVGCALLARKKRKRA